MNHYYLLNSIIPENLGFDKLENFLTEKLQSSLVTLEGEFEPSTIVTAEMIAESSAASAISDLKTIDLRANPYNRVFLSYLFKIFKNTPTINEIRAQVNIDNFHAYVKARYGDSDSRKKMNYADIRPSVDYVISVENCDIDLKAIPELADEDTTVALKGMEFLYNNMYRDFYDDETKAIIASAFDKDIQTYGYTF